jgi:aminoglycoside phosphotransferase (APT) family kinase protein
VLLLEDVGGRQGDVLAGCSAEEAAGVFEAIASVHAGRWATDGFPPWTTDPAARQARYAERVDAFLERYGDVVPAPVATIAAALRTRLGEVAEELRAGASTLIHGDLHLDNMLFDAGGRPVAILDWQSAVIGPPAWDLALFLSSSLAVEERRAAEDGLLRGYLAALGVPGYTEERLRRDYALALLAVFAGMIGWLAAPEREEATARERAVRRAAVADGRLAAALLDHGRSALG